MYAQRHICPFSFLLSLFFTQCLDQKDFNLTLTEHFLTWWENLTMFTRNKLCEMVYSVCVNNKFLKIGVFIIQVRYLHFKSSLIWLDFLFEGITELLFVAKKWKESGIIRSWFHFWLYIWLGRLSLVSCRRGKNSNDYTFSTTKYCQEQMR